MRHAFTKKLLARESVTGGPQIYEDLAPAKLVEAALANG